MTEPDADDADAASDEVTGESEPGADDPVASDGSEEALEDIPTEGDGDVDGALGEVLAGEADRESDLPAVEPDEALVERVEDADAESVARELLALRERVDDLETALAERDETVDDLESRLARKQADFQNYKQRQSERMEEEKERATEDLVARLLDVRDNLSRALDQDEDADIRGGVESTLRQLDAEFERENVTPIEPEPGEATDPQRHEVLMRVESDRPEGTVADLHRPGYEMAGKVLRAAQVTVSEGADSGTDGDAAE